MLSSSFLTATEVSKAVTMMQKLKPLEGIWSMVVEFTPDEGKTWKASKPAKVNVELGHKNMLLREIPINPSAEGFNMETSIQSNISVIKPGLTLSMQRIALGYLSIHINSQPFI